MADRMLLQLTDSGLYCAEGDFYIDPWQPVGRAVVTHGHADHTYPGSRRYLSAADGLHVLRQRLGPDAQITTLSLGETLQINGVNLSLHGAGHILGSAQVRLERGGEVWVVSGDYKTGQDPTCAPFELLPCHTFITEATFGLPIYRWPSQPEVFAEINRWWRANQAEGRASVIFAYALGKAQRVLAGVDPHIGPIYVHGAVHVMNQAYAASGVALPPTEYAQEYVRSGSTKPDWSQALIVAPPSAQGTPWLQRFGEISTGFASGWMRVRGQRRRRSYDRGFVLSDHVDWPSLLEVVSATGAERVLVTHGYVAPVVRWLREHRVDAYGLDTRFGDEDSLQEAGQEAGQEPNEGANEQTNEEAGQATGE
jgi:putative mRNA 3-end processing factor